MQNNIFLSIVIPTYNRANMLVATLRSLELQTCKDFQVIVVDDGSTDSTKQLFNMHWDLKLTYIYQDNQERGAARNQGILNAKADLIYFLDSDDTLLPNHVETLKKFSLCYPDSEIIAARYSFDGEIKKSNSIPSAAAIFNSSCLLRGNQFACNFAIKKSSISYLFSTNRNIATAEDWLFLLENAFSTNKLIYVLPAQTVSMSMHGGRSMNGGASVGRARLYAAKQSIKSLNIAGINKRTILAHSYYNSSVHNFIDRNYCVSLRQLCISIMYLPSPYILGRSVIMSIRNLVSLLRHVSATMFLAVYNALVCFK